MSCKGLFADPSFTVMHTVTSSAIPVHSHSEYVVTHYLSGHSECRIGNNLLVDFQQGDTALLNPGEVHQDYESHGTRDYLMVSIKKDFFRELAESLERSQEMPLFLSPKLGGDARVKRIFETLIAEVDCQGFGREVLLRSLVTQLAVHLFRQFTPSAIQLERYELEHTKARYQVRKAIEHLGDNFSKPFNLDQLATASGLSKYHFERVFKQATGLTPHNYALMLRVERAKGLLASTAKPIAEIAIDLRFAHQSHFTNVFKRLTGMTPRTYRLESK